MQSNSFLRELMMHSIKLDLKQGSASVDLTPIEIGENGTLVNSIAKLCSRPIRTNHGRTRYHVLEKISVCGQFADGLIEVEGEVFSLTVLFDLIHFFTSSILESEIIKACEQSLNLKFTSSHPSTAFLESRKWGSAVFSYDPKQGDLSLEIRFEHRSTQSSPSESFTEVISSISYSASNTPPVDEPPG